MVPCEKPLQPGQGAGDADWAEYAVLLAEYIACLIDNAGGPYTGVCSDLDTLEEAIERVEDGTPADSTPPLVGLARLAGQYVSQLTTAKGPPINQAYVSWGKGNMGSYRSAAGC